MSDRAPVVRVARVAPLVAPLVALLVVAAMRPASVARAQQPVPADWRARLLRTARGTTFGAERAPVLDPALPRNTPTTGIPSVTFAATTGRRGDVGVAGRITSRAAYPRLGIPRGVSYLWVVSRAPVRMAIVPADAAQPAHWLPTRPHGSSSSTTLCRANPFATQLGLERPTGTTQLMMAACTCVNGVWMHSGGSTSPLSVQNVHVLLAQ